MEQLSSSSKVTVEYFDPFGVYQLLSPGLLSRLPLRKLHWESHAGPLRSIQSLHVDLVPSADTRPPSSASNADPSRVKSTDSTGSGDDGFRIQALGAVNPERERPDSRSSYLKAQTKGRRHQIPGLRQTPYLKIFFLRCDDGETYKSQARKQVREWIKEHTLPPQSTSKNSAQENHDTFEWLIIHIVVPNTAAATQSRTSTKGPSTILEKLKSDFNGSSRSAVDRVAQIRIGINDVPYDILPRVVPAIPGSYTESPQDHEVSWVDLITKLKSLILATFDMRVSQYEEDIREKDAQRSLPGWNFCTFFVLKEGLARGFESVGLIEDALVGYDELAVGLDAIIREQAVTGSGAEHGGTFLPYTEDLRSQVERRIAAILKEIGIEEGEDDKAGPIDLQDCNDAEADTYDEIPLRADKKPYRDLILANNISIFDFKSYIFARQLSLLLRMGNAWSSQEELLAKLKEQRESSLQGVAARQPPSQPSEDTENLATLGEICQRSLDFIASISRIMRDDLVTSSTVLQGDKSTADRHRMQLIDNIVSSFTFSTAQQILAQTSTRSLPIPASTLAPPSSSISTPGQEPKAAIPEPKTMMHPARTTSLTVNPSTVGGGPPSPGIFPGQRSSLQDPVPATTSFLKAGLEELAAHRAELYLLSRNVLQRLGEQRSWLVGWNIEGWDGVGIIQMKDVDLDDQTSESEQQGPMFSPSLHGIENNLLRAALDNEDDFNRLYETFTDKAMRHYTVANHIQSVQTNMADLAILKFHLRDYAAAASYFYRMTPFYGEAGWEEIEMGMLVMYTRCLKKLKRNDEYVRVVLKLLARGAAAEKNRLDRRSAYAAKSTSSLEKEDGTSVDGYLTDLLVVIPSVQHEVSVPLQSLFASVEVEGPILYQKGRDGFALQLKLRYLLKDDFPVEQVKVRLAPLIGGQGRDIWLETDGSILFKQCTIRLQVSSSAIIPGTYTLKQVILSSGKMTLSYEAEGVTQSINSTPKFLRSPKILLYQRPDAFDVKLSASRYIHLDRNRSLEIELSSGWNEVQSGDLHVRAATAGLRLQTSEVKVINGDLEVLKGSNPGVIQFGPLQSADKVKLRMPFTLEHEVNDISLRIEISYTTKDGTFFFASNPSISIMLPLGVNVQDVFKHKALFSKFTISSASTSPLRLLSTRLEDSDVFEAQSGGDLRNPVVIFSRQPASILYKITRRASPMPTNVARRKPKSSLSLVVHYVCLEEEIDNSLESALTDALRDSEFHEYSRLVVPIVLSQLQPRLTPPDLERAALIGEVSTSMLADVRWQDHFVGLPQSKDPNADTPTLIALWLQRWRDQWPTLPLLPVKITPETITNSRSISIPVEVPSVTIVHTADLQLLQNPETNPREVVAATGQPIPASLHIKWTRMWDSNTQSDSETRTTPQIRQTPRDLEFVYELSAPPDTWLIGGKRKGHFKIPAGQDNETLRFPVLLFPVKEGYLQYPALEIRPLVVAAAAQPKPSSAPQPAMGGGGEEEEEEEEGGGEGEEAHHDNNASLVTCETDYKNSAETLRVISNARKTTVSLDASGPHGGAWLLEMERRGDENDVFVR